VPYLVASATLTAQCPAISLNPATITQNAEPAPVLVTGTTFYPGPAVAIAVDGNQVSSATTDGNGGFSTSVTAQGLSCGTHQVTANQFVDALSQTLSASATLTVACNQSKLALDPAVLEPGELTHVTGTGFTPGQPVTLTWRLRGGGPPLLGRASVTANGTGGIAAWLMVMPNDVLGQRQLVATQGGSTATANAVVDGGPMEPSTGDRLIYRSS
jgi:hypothetical protein